MRKTGVQSTLQLVLEAETEEQRNFYKMIGDLKIVLPGCDLAAIYDNTEKFRGFAIYKNGNLVRLSHDVPDWYKRFAGDYVFTREERQR